MLHFKLNAILLASLVAACHSNYDHRNLMGKKAAMMSMDGGKTLEERVEALEECNEVCLSGGGGGTCEENRARIMELANNLPAGCVIGEGNTNTTKGFRLVCTETPETRNSILLPEMCNPFFLVVGGGGSGGHGMGPFGGGGGAGELLTFDSLDRIQVSWLRTMAIALIFFSSLCIWVFGQTGKRLFHSYWCRRNHRKWRRQQHPSCSNCHPRVSRNPGNWWRSRWRVRQLRPVVKWKIKHSPNRAHPFFFWCPHAEHSKQRS